MIKLITILLVIIISTLAYGQESFELRPGESISSLLYKRLKIRPTSVSDINKVLDYNNIAPEAVRALRVGSSIKVPPEVLQKSQIASITQPVETSQAAPIIETATTPEWERKLFKGVGIIFERMRSIGNQVENVHLTALRPSFFILPTIQNDKNLLQGRLEGSLLILQKDIKREGAASFLLGEGSLEYLRGFNDFYLGLKTRLSNQVLILPFVDSYEVFSKWLWGYGPVIQWKQWSLQHLIIPDQGDGPRETQSNFETSLAYNFLYDEHEFQGKAFYGNTSIEAVDTREFGFALEYYF